MADRKQLCTVLFGGNGSGKTTEELSILLAYADANEEKRSLILVPDDGERKFDNISEIEPTENALREFRGIKKLIVDDIKIFDMILKVYTEPMKKANGAFVTNTRGEKVHEKFNGLMICDDMGVMLNRRPENVLKLFKRRRQANIDMLWTFHSLDTDIPKSFFSYVTDVILFQTSGNHQDTLKKIEESKKEEFERVYFEVQEEAKQNPYARKRIILRPI